MSVISASALIICLVYYISEILASISTNLIS